MAFFHFGTERRGKGGGVTKQPIFYPGQAHISDIRSRRRHLGMSIQQIHFELFELVYLLFCGSPQKREKKECLRGQNNILLTRNALSFIVFAIITALRVFAHFGSILKVLLIESQFGVLMLFVVVQISLFQQWSEENTAAYMGSPPPTR